LLSIENEDVFEGEGEDVFEGEDGELLMKVKSEGEEYCCLFLEVMLFRILL
jgi:hypothetical protein